MEKWRVFVKFWKKNFFMANTWVLGFCDDAPQCLSRERFARIVAGSLHSRVSRQVNWSGRSLRFFTNGLFLKSLDAFVEFQRARTARTITLRLQIRPWFIAPLFAPLIFRKALLVASQRVVTNYSIDAPIFQMRSLRTFFHHLKTDLV